MSEASQRRTPFGSRAVALLFVFLFVGLAASGCVRVHAAIAVSGTDQVSGDVVVAALPSAQDDHGPQLVVPVALAGRASTKSYAADGYVGAELIFTDLTFDELTQLIAAANTNASHYHLNLHRSGGVVTLSGSADLTQVPSAGSDVQLKVNFPGSVLHTNGTVANGTVSWTPKPGLVTTFDATDQYLAGEVHGWGFWALVLGGGGFLASGLVALLALWARKRNLRKEGAILA